MIIQTRAFGPMDIDERQVLQFPSGILGFEQHLQFALIDARQPPFYMLQSLVDCEVAFVVVAPTVFRSDFRLDLVDGDYADIELESHDDLLVFAIVTIPVQGNDVTGNLQGPIIVNRRRRIAKQAIQLSATWTTRHPLAEDQSC